MDMRFDAWSVGAVLLVLALAWWGIRLIRQRIDDQLYRDELAELEFEQSVFSSVQSGSHESQDLAFLQSGTTPASFESDAPSIPKSAFEIQVAKIGDESVAADIAANAVMEKLRISGLLRSVEGYIDLHGNPKGAAILCLRNGRRALLVPHMESEAFFRRHARRVDLFIISGTDGNGLIISAMSQWLAENLSER